MYQPGQKLEATQQLKDNMEKSGKKFVYNSYTFIFSSAQEALLDYHMPFKFDASKIKTKEVVEPLFQKDFFNYYSKSRKTPVFTAERLIGKLLNVNEHYLCIASTI